MAMATVGALLVASCGAAPRPSSSSPEATSTGAAPAAREPTGADGLLIANGAELRITTAAGLVRFDGPSGPVVEVVAARGVVVAVDGDGRVERSIPPPAGPRSWLAVPLEAGESSNSRLIALSPDARTLALAVGQMQARSFQLVLVDLTGGSRRALDVGRGLDGPPVWIGPSTIAVHTIGPGQSAGFTEVDSDAGRVTDGPSIGFAIAASASGDVVAFDQASTGDVLLGPRSDATAAGLARLGRFRGPPDTVVERLALSADGRRLAIVRRTAEGATIELLRELDGTWRSGRTIVNRGERAVSVAWLE
ncbi:MAG: hypothetical protein ABIQ76_05070 [Candidatus Limnocylindrales bacterium]